MTGPQRKRLVSIGTFGTLLTLLTVAADYAGSLEPLERALYDLRLRRCQVFAKPTTDKLAHIDIDDGALAQVGKWPWSRGLIADIVDELKYAGAKVIVFDVLFAEPNAPEVVKDPATGRFASVDHDEDLARAVERAGNVLLASSLKFKPMTPPDLVEQAVEDLLLADLELDPAEVSARLAAAGVRDEKLPQRVAANFVAIRGEAMCTRITQELDGTGDVDVEGLTQRLLPQAAARAGSVSPLERQLKDAYEHVQILRALRRFVVPVGGTPPALLETDGGVLPMARLAKVAAYGGFTDYLPDRDGTVRSIPLAVWHEGEAFPQISLVAACAVMGIDVRSIRIADGSVVLPRQDGSGDVIIPTRRIPDGPFAGAGSFLDIPLFGKAVRDGNSWEQIPGRVSILDVVGPCQTRERIERNDATAVTLLARVLDVINPDEAEAVRAQPPPAEELGVVVDDALDTLASTTDSFAGLSDPTPEEAAELARLRKAEGSARQLGAWKRERTRLATQLAAARERLAPRIRDRAVFIGSISTGAFDFVATPLDSRCPGVYLHGAAFNAVMTGESWRVAPRWTAFAIAAVMGLLTTVLIAAFSPPKAAVAVSLLAAGYAGVNGFLLFDRNNLIVGAAGPLVAAGVVWSGVTLIQFVREIGERTRLTRRFRSYVDPTLVSYVIENPDQARLEAQERELTVAFCDLAGFTTLSERLRTESAKMLGKYMETMVPLIRARRGYVNKFLGDGIMFFFGAPLENPDHAACAVGACLDMQAALVPFNADLARRGLPTLAMRTGVSTGLMVVGDAGPSFASDYTVLGDAVNLAARLESANKAMGTNNLITARTVEMIGERFLIRPVANLLVVGKKNSVWVHEALAPMETATAEQKRFAAMTAAFVKPFGARDFESCLAACRAFEEAFGKSKLSELYASEAATCLRSKPGDDFCGLITLQAK
jgi:class 3 adenylate cyclase